MMERNETDTINAADMLIKDMRDMLAKQTAMAIQGDMDGVEALLSDTENLMQKIAELKVTDSASLMDKKNELQRMYEKLILIIAGHKNETFQELTKTRKSKAVLGVYKKDIC